MNFLQYLGALIFYNIQPVQIYRPKSLKLGGTWHLEKKLQLLANPSYNLTTVLYLLTEKMIKSIYFSSKVHCLGTKKVYFL